MNHRLHAPLVAACAAGILSLAPGASAAEATGLSDTGNLFRLTGGLAPPSPPYFDGRFSNGPVHVERLSPRLGIPYDASWNLAFGGAGLTPPGVLTQVNGFALRGGNLAASDLVVVWAGANDYLGDLPRRRTWRPSSPGPSGTCPPP